MTSASLGVTVGKFYPPHVGHAHLIRTAAGMCERLVVIVAERPGQAISGAQRAAWIAEEVPDAVVACTLDDLPEQPEPWARRALEVLGSVPDVAFTSEDYGEPWAAAMGARHVSVDALREAHPVSGTAVRGDLRGQFRSLVGAARRDLSRKVVVVGAESSGTTTLAESLARELRTVVVPEYGREYWVSRETSQPGAPWTGADFEHIAREHHRRGDLIARDSTGVTVHDTDALATAVWHRRYLGERSPAVEALAAERVPDLYIVTAPDFPFVQDGTRVDGPHRAAMHRWFLEAVAASGAPWIVVEGDRDARLRVALDAVEALPPVVLP